jgi:DNA (cytosine-5)-methyltransferase 1
VPIEALDLFSGIGGFALACERVGIRTVGFCEVDPFCRAVLAKHWPGVPIHDDVRTLDPAAFRGVELIVGGFPCQDVSAAGKGEGIGGTRSGLWFEMARIIAGVRPRWCLIENVSALRTRGADRVLADLEEIGYDAWPFVVGAWAVGAPHRRDRVWIVAHAVDGRGDGRGPAFGREAGDQPARVGTGRRGLADHDGSGLREPGEGDAGSQRDTGRNAARRGGRVVADADRIGLGRRGESEPRGIEGARRDEPHGRGQRGTEEAHYLGDPERDGLQSCRRAAADLAHERRDRTLWPARPGEPQHEWEAPRLTQFAVGRVADGLPAGLVRARRRNNREALRAYGNAVVPQVVEAILRAMLEQAPA